MNNKIFHTIIFSVLLLCSTTIVLADSLIISPTDFVPQNDSVKYSLASYYLQNDTDGPATFWAPIHLPQDSMVTSIHITYVAWGDSLTISMQGYNIYNDRFRFMAAFSSTGSYPAWVNAKVSPIHNSIINNKGYIYTVSVNFPGSGPDFRLMSVKINYTPPN